jgi:hypothetical protein
MKRANKFLWGMLGMFLFGWQPMNAQVREVWVHRYPEGDMNSAYIWASALDRQGNPVVIGTVFPGGATIKYDRRTGVPLWIARIGGASVVLRAIVSDTTGNVYVAGNSNPSSTRDYLIVKYNGETGQQLWVARYNGPGNDTDAAEAIALDQDGNLYVTGYSVGIGTQGDYATVKYNGETGQQLWVARYSTPASETAYAIAVDQAGNVFVSGSSGTIKYHGQTGQMLWGPKPGRGRAIALDGQGNVLVTGGTGGGYTTYKFDGQTGQQLWMAFVNNPEGNGLAVSVDANGDVYMTGSFSTVNGNRDRCLVIKYFGQNGSVLWSRELLGTCNTLRLDQANHVYVAGTSQRIGFPGPGGDFRSAKLDGRTGQIVWQTTSFSGEASTIQVDLEGHVYVAGRYYLSSTDWPSFLTIKYEQAPPGDVNLDFCVDDGDLLRVLLEFGRTGDLPEDVNRDGVVDDQDLLTVLFHFGRGCGVE